MGLPPGWDVALVSMDTADSVSALIRYAASRVDGLGGHIDDALMEENVVFIPLGGAHTAQRAAGHATRANAP